MEKKKKKPDRFFFDIGEKISPEIFFFVRVFVRVFFSEKKLKFFFLRVFLPKATREGSPPKGLFAEGKKPAYTIKLSKKYLELNFLNKI